MQRILVIIALLLLVGVLFLKRNSKHLKKLNNKLSTANNQLKNNKLQLEKANQKLLKNNHLQQQHMVKYLQLSSSYIKKIDDYRLAILRQSKQQKTEKVITFLKSKDIIHNELNIFYKEFDQSFLTLFPNFVEEYNSLLRSDERHQLKNDNELNPELRIFALIRLGISDSNTIANFLRYSLSTIYNYRTKARNKAIGNRDNFEKNIQKISQIE